MAPVVEMAKSIAMISEVSKVHAQMGRPLRLPTHVVGNPLSPLSSGRYSEAGESFLEN
jgi:hypothetical protein